MITIKDLTCVDGMYYIGHLIDIDGSPWVYQNEAIEILKLINL